MCANILYYLQMMFSLSIDKLLMDKSITSYNHKCSFRYSVYPATYGISSSVIINKIDDLLWLCQC